MKNKLFVSNFVLKIIAIITMTLDHVGLFLAQYFATENIQNLSTIFRGIGRIALPLFCFLLVEGALHTKSFKKYGLRLLVILVPILIVQIVSDFGFNNALYQGNIFIDLLLGLVAIYCLRNKNPKFKWILIPIFIYALLSMICYGYEANTNYQTMIWWLPYFLRPQYDIYSLLLILGIYLVKTYVTPTIFMQRGMNVDLYKETEMYMLTENLLSAFIIVAVTLGQFVIGFIAKNYLYWNLSLQVWAIASAIFILGYNFKLGYHKKWFVYFEYLYYPAHLVIIYLIFFLITR